MTKLLDQTREADWSRPRLLKGTCLLLVVICAGCKTPQASSSSHLATQDFPNRSVREVQTATRAVLARHQFREKARKGQTLVFEREGDSMDYLAYGGFMATGVIERVQILVSAGDAGFTRLEIDAFTVRDPGDIRFEEVQKRRRSSPYKELVKEIESQFP